MLMGQIISVQLGSKYLEANGIAGVISLIVLAPGRDDSVAYVPRSWTRSRGSNFSL